MKKKKYDFIVSVGRDCACSIYLRENNLQTRSYPFDWLTNNASLEGCLDDRFNLILNDFKDFINIEDLEYLPKDPEVFNDENYDYYANTKNKLYFYHDFPKGVELKESWPGVQEKYQRRISRFYKSIKENEKILFVWFAHQPNISDEKIVEYSKKINKKFNKDIDIIIFENNQDYPVKDEFDTIALNRCVTKYILNTYPENATDKTKGNVELCNEIFKLYHLNESQKDIWIRRVKKLKKTLIRILCLFIPVKNWRKRLRGQKIQRKLSLSKAISKLPFIPNIKTSEETVEALLDAKTSICRFGDGEFNLIHGNSIPFQNASPQLSKRLKKILQSNDKNIAIGINYYFWNYSKKHFNIIAHFHNTWVSNNLNKITSLLSPENVYYNSTFTTHFCCFKDYDFEGYYERVKDIWQKKDVTIICGERVFNKIKYNIFDCAKSVKFIYSSSKNAFDHYDDLLKEAKKINKNRIIVIILGPTATILAYDLAKLGYQALDIGHIAKDYDCYLREVKHNDETIQGFFDPD